MTVSKSRPWRVDPNATTRIVGGLFRSRNYVWDSDSKVAAQFDLTWTQFLILRALRFGSEDFTLSPTALYEATQATSSGTATVLRALEQKQLVDRIANPDDGRSTLVRLTESGADLVEAIVDRLIETNTALFDGILSEQEKDALAGLLEKLSVGLQDRKTDS